MYQTPNSYRNLKKTKMECSLAFSNQVKENIILLQHINQCNDLIDIMFYYKPQERALQRETYLRFKFFFDHILFDMYPSVSNDMKKEVRLLRSQLVFFTDPLYFKFKIHHRKSQIQYQVINCISMIQNEWNEHKSELMIEKKMIVDFLLNQFDILSLVSKIITHRLHQQKIQHILQTSVESFSMTVTLFDFHQMNPIQQDIKMIISHLNLKKEIDLNFYYLPPYPTTSHDYQSQPTQTIQSFSYMTSSYTGGMAYPVLSQNI